MSRRRRSLFIRGDKVGVGKNRERAGGQGGTRETRSDAKKNEEAEAETDLERKRERERRLQKKLKFVKLFQDRYFNGASIS